VLIPQLGHLGDRQLTVHGGKKRRKKGTLTHQKLRTQKREHRSHTRYEGARRSEGRDEGSGAGRAREQLHQGEERIHVGEGSGPAGEKWWMYEGA
jgi:hypothetical protein